MAESKFALPASHPAIAERIVAELTAPPAGVVAKLRRVPRRALETPGFYLVAMLVLVLAAVGWASLATVDRVVRVEGRVIPAGRGQTIQHLEGGIVSSIDAKEGQAVHKGDILVVIDDTSAESSLAETRIKSAGQRLKALRLEAEANVADQMTVPPDLESYRELVEAERSAFQARRAKLDQEREIFIEQARQQMASLSEAESRRAKLAGELDTARKRVDLIKGMAAHDAASHLEVLEAESREQHVATDISDAEHAVPKLQAAIAETQARAQELTARYRADAQADLSQTLVEIDRLQQIVAAQKDRFTRTEVRAPVDGIINKVNVTTVGGVVKPGDTLIELTPTTNTVLLEARARPQDRAELRPGLPAKVRISAFDVGEFGPLRGHVTEVSSDSMADPKGEAYYRVAIVIEQLPDSYAGKRIIPGMTIEGDVVIGRRTVMKYITSAYSKFTYNAFRDAR